MYQRSKKRGDCNRPTSERCLAKCVTGTESEHISSDSVTLEPLPSCTLSHFEDAQHAELVRSQYELECIYMCLYLRVSALEMFEFR